MLSVRSLNLQFQDFDLLVDDLELQPGQAVWLQGANGAGKSMLLKSLAGIFQARSARQRVASFELTRAPEDYKREVVYVGNLRRAYAHMTVGEVLAFCARCYPRWRQSEVDALAPRLAMPLGQKVARLSQGMNAKLNFLIAAGSGAGIFLVDELLSPIDADSKAVIADFFAARLAAGAALIHCSHGDDELTPLTTERWRMQNGRLLRPVAARKETLQ